MRNRQLPKTKLLPDCLSTVKLRESILWTTNYRYVFKSLYLQPITIIVLFETVWPRPPLMRFWQLGGRLKDLRLCNHTDFQVTQKSSANEPHKLSQVNINTEFIAKDFSYLDNMTEILYVALLSIKQLTHNIPAQIL